MRTIIDVETNILNKGHPFSKGGKLVCVGARPLAGNPQIHWCGTTQELSVQNQINSSRLLIGFNIKFDLHWLRRENFWISGPLGTSVWDCQLAHFILTGQAHPYPSLNDVAAYYGLGQKIDIIKLEFWDHGIDTDKIPTEILGEYLEQDLLLTEQVYLKQVEHFQRESKALYRLFRLQCQDLLVLADMEYNGMFFDEDLAEKLKEEGEKEINEIEKELQNYFPDIPINWDSRDHVSCCLYGGTIIVEDRVPIGFYKTGAKLGEVRYKVIEHAFKIPQMVTPPRGSELKKEGYYATNEPTLRTIRGNKATKHFVSLLLRRAEKNKLVGTYYKGIPELIREMQWPKSTIHGQFNQCVATTGRLSSSKPNLQNFAGDVDILLRSQYD